LLAEGQLDDCLVATTSEEGAYTLKDVRCVGKVNADHVSVLREAPSEYQTDSEQAAGISLIAESAHRKCSTFSVWTDTENTQGRAMPKRLQIALPNRQNTTMIANVVSSPLAATRFLVAGVSFVGSIPCGVEGRVHEEHATCRCRSVNIDSHSLGRRVFNLLHRGKSLLGR